MDSINPILVFILRELIKLAWILILLFIFVTAYLVTLYVNKSRNYKRMTNELGYPMPEIANTFLGHIKEHTSIKKQAEWHKRFGKVYGFYNCDAPHLRVSDLKTINQVFLKQSKIFSARTFNEYRLIGFNDGILFSCGACWRRARRLIQPIMSAFRMSANEISAGEGAGGKMNEELSEGITLLIDHFKQLASADTDRKRQQQHESADNDDGCEKDEEHSREARACLAAKRYCEINERGYAPVLDSRSPTGYSIDIEVHGVMEALTLDMIMRIGLDIDQVDVRKGSADPLVKFVDSWLNDFDDPLAKIAQAIPLVRLVAPLMWTFNKTVRSYFEFLIDTFEQHKRRLLTEATRGKQSDVGATANGKRRQREPRTGPTLASDEVGSKSAESICSGQRGARTRKSVLGALIEEYLAGRMPKREVLANAGLTIVAGFETTATTTSYILWCIARHPQLKAKLLADILVHGIHSRYLDMFIKETMRMYPALANFVIRSPSEDTVVSGRLIGRGMSVYLDMITVHYDETIYPDPYKFDPERFAEGRTYPPGAYVPFGLGHRMCAGTHLAMREMKIIVTRLLANFDIELISPQLELELESLTIFLTRSKHQIRVRLIPRDGNECQRTGC